MTPAVSTLTIFSVKHTEDYDSQMGEGNNKTWLRMLMEYSISCK